MSAERIEVVRRALDAIGRRDLPAMLAEADPEIVVHPLVTVWQGTYRGHEGIEAWVRDVGELWDEFTVDPEGFREMDDDALLVKVHWRGRAKGSPVEVDGPGAAVIRFRGVKAVSASFYLNEDLAERAVRP